MVARKIKNLLKIIIIKMSSFLGFDPSLIMISREARRSIAGYGAEKKTTESLIISFYANGEGNFGDWLSIYIANKMTEKKIIFRHLDVKGKKNIIIGSVVAAACEETVVLGAGINYKNDEINKNTVIIGVRGKETYSRLTDEQKINNKFVCDPGFFIKKLYNEKKIDGDKCIFIPHLNHSNIKITTKEKWKVMSAAARKSDEIENILRAINSAEVIATTAMHVAIVAAAYNKKIIFFKEEGFKKIPGDGVKYNDAFDEEIAELNIKKFNEVINLSTADAKFSNVNEVYLRNAYKAFESELKKL